MVDKYIEATERPMYKGEKKMEHLRTLAKVFSS